MFTGIVEELGEVVARDDLPNAARLTVRGPLVTSDVSAGDSIAVNGVCLTVADRAGETLPADVMQETLDKTGLGQLAHGAPVNLERAVTADKRLGGHIVQGHVDAVGSIRGVEPEGEGARLEVEAPESILRLCVEKGSIAVDGVSLTIAAVGSDSLEIALVPHTLTATTLGSASAGDPVNLEVDVLAKYIERLLARR